MYAWKRFMNIGGHVFQDRKDAGRQLAKELFQFADQHPVIVALPRGGVPVGYEIASLLHAQLTVIVVRKIVAPGRSEFGVGAVAEGDTIIFDETLLKMFDLTIKDLNTIIKYETAILRKRVITYRGTSKLPKLKNRTVIIVDDGLATGVTARAAIETVRKLDPIKIIFATPVCAYDSAKRLLSEADNVICLTTPIEFLAVGMWYRKFDQTTDKEVVELLHKNHKERKWKQDKQMYKSPHQ